MYYLKARSVTIEKIYDSFIDVYDSELLLCKVSSKDPSKNGLTWFKLDDAPAKLLSEFKSGIDTKDAETTCSTDKTKVNTCDYKTRTCGLQIFCSNCGVILGFRELYGSESCTQVSMMLLDLHENFTGDFF